MNVIRFRSELPKGAKVGVYRLYAEDVDTGEITFTHKYTFRSVHKAKAVIESMENDYTDNMGLVPSERLTNPHWTKM